MLQVELSPEEIRTAKPYRQWDMTDAEYARFTDLIGHLPTFTEVGLASGMWSEHCAYKYSKPVLRRFWTKNENVVMGPGEGAGAIRIGDGKVVVFKAESHNHPSAVEPYEGAATGVGGIIRDIFSMGAKPIAVLDSLRFGELDNPRTRQLLDQIVAGIAGYGNAIGIPTVGGETAFDPTYARNPLVNAMCVGIMDEDQLQKGRAAGVGNAILYVGAKTGRDGINGASFASGTFSDSEAADRSAVQVGDPFMEKLLVDACLEVTNDHQDILVGMQDMGAAGLVSSSVEMAGKADSGMQLDLDLVPQREPGMTPFEIMLSESQERMLLCVAAGHEDEISAIFARYGLDAVVIGRVTASHQYILTHHGETVCDIPVSSLTSDAPVYQQESRRPARLDSPAAPWQPAITDPTAAWLTLMNQPTIASKASLYGRYDAQVQTNTVVLPGSDAAVLRIKGTQRAIAVTTDSAGRFVYLDPAIGGQRTVAEAAANLVASGAAPLGITDCLNYGDPTKPEIFYELATSAAGITAATKVFNTPVISGNVSLYNETNGTAIYPTPMVGMVGVIDDLTTITTPAFKQPDDLVYLVGETTADFSGSEVQKMLTGTIGGTLPALPLTAIKDRQDHVLRAIRTHLVSAVHDISEGGLLAALAEMAFPNMLGAALKINVPAAWLFSETPGRFLITVAPAHQQAFEAALGGAAALLGTVTAAPQFTIAAADATFLAAVPDLHKAWEEGIPCRLN
ncbi:phosphoribosylformylglycinamidine synthase subunit PurL [Schleiferilactobacillus shenzhenensis]|uniref:Phosphoribosylformylglycinamidine synthase subunit PurL n=1 Tax=Schleiferilactobacillus shenzhenensis LY-73 TaxID=1231336 RepID=U4TKZ2_9LACO|nr:phosphoribosylformylglycinamidine synthase subunit PurL [Schleiferilactobacillus shenzhenensis]ERL64844.1 PurL [Schleiferilactobacillus shenzhenensis LY-73]